MLQHLENSSIFKYLTVDTEGFIQKETIDGRGYFNSGILGLSIANPALQTMYFPIGHREDVNVDAEVLNTIIETLEKVPYRIMHNAAHDLDVLPFLSDLPFVCTMIMGHMVDENVMSKSLDFMHKFHCGGEGKVMNPLMASIIKTMGWYYVPFELINEYGGHDALITMELFLKILPKYEAQFGPLWSTELTRG